MRPSRPPTRWHLLQYSSSCCLESIFPLIPYFSNLLLLDPLPCFLLLCISPPFHLSPFLSSFCLLLRFPYSFSLLQPLSHYLDVSLQLFAKLSIVLLQPDSSPSSITTDRRTFTGIHIPQDSPLPNNETANHTSPPATPSQLCHTFTEPPHPPTIPHVVFTPTENTLFPFTIDRWI